MEMFHTIRIRPYELGLIFHRDVFAGVLEPGDYRRFDPFGRERIETVNLRKPFLTSDHIELLAQTPALAERATLLDVLAQDARDEVSAWRAVSDDELDFVPADRGGAFALLAPGIGLQVITQSPLRLSGDTFDRYLRAGVIMFNPLGKLDVVAYSVPAASSLGTDVLGATTDLVFPNPAYIPNPFPADAQLLSQSGLVIYDAINFREQAGEGAKTGDFYYSYRSDGDFLIPGKSPEDSKDLNARVVDEFEEETWLTNNALPLLINPQTGASTVVQ
jgi:hypothetical protein